MGEPLLVRKIKDALGRDHTLAAGKDFCWQSCREHNNTLTDALAGLPGVPLPCQTGVGWGDERLIRVGWPIWLAHIGWWEARSNENTPQEVLAFLLQQPGINKDESLLRMISNPQMTEELQQLLLAKYPLYGEAVEQCRRDQAWLSDLAEASLAGVSAVAAMKVAKGWDLREIPQPTLQQLLAHKWPVVREHLARNPTAPTWVLVELVEDYAGSVARNPSASADLWGEIATTQNIWAGRTPAATDLLVTVALHPNCRPSLLAALSQCASEPVARTAGLELAKRTLAGRVELEEELGVEVELAL